jgi:cation:H+ antiporter
MMVWITFILCASVLVFAASKLAAYSDIIAVRTRLGGMFVGTLLLAGATSLPELLSALNALTINEPNLAAGSMFGSNMFNMFMLAILDMISRQARILRRVAMNHALTAGLAILLIAMAVFFLMANLNAGIGWVGIDSLLIIAAYIVGIRLIQGQGSANAAPTLLDEQGIPSLTRALIGFLLAAGVLVVITPYLVGSANQIATLTGLSAGFIGATLLAVTTSLPELVATVAAVRIGAFDLAIGNLFGSNLFNMFALGITDVLYTGGYFLGMIDPQFALVGMIGLILTVLGLIGNIARVERRLLIMEVDALVIAVVYLLGMWFLYSRGIGI